MVHSNHSSTDDLAPPPSPDALRLRQYRQIRREKGLRTPGGKVAYSGEFIAIDGEGENHPFAAFSSKGQRIIPQSYKLIAASSRDGSFQKTLHKPGWKLSTEEILDWILELPKEARLVGFALNYDYTKWLIDMPKQLVHLLFSPDKRKPPDGAPSWGGGTPVFWHGYRLNWIGGRLSVAKGKRSRTIWDIFKFFQTSFLKARESWLPELPADEFLSGMKKGRTEGRIGQNPVEDEKYCLQECQELAEIMARVYQASADVGLKLRSFFGAGSIASRLIQVHGTSDFRGDGGPSHVKAAANAAYFGGRFEISAHGPIHADIYEHDINSAYPWACQNLPCLVCGEWSAEGEADTDEGQCAILYVKWDIISRKVRWGPLPSRIYGIGLAFPLKGEGWYWREEVRAAQRLYGKKIKVVAAYVYRSACEHRTHDWIPERYEQRLQLGKNGRGIILKLGLNAMYGKYAQRIGNPPYACQIWAGLITARTRALLLDQIKKAGQNGILAFATDAVYATKDLGISSEGKPLGGFDKAVHPGGAFFVRSGVIIAYDERGPVKARGVNKQVLRLGLASMEKEWEEQKTEGEYKAKMTAFLGGKAACLAEDQRLRGEWYEREVDITFGLVPKRDWKRGLDYVDGIARSYPIPLFIVDGKIGDRYDPRKQEELSENNPDLEIAPF